LFIVTLACLFLAQQAEPFVATFEAGPSPQVLDFQQGADP
jgi:hypothetical protein